MNGLQRSWHNLSLRDQRILVLGSLIAVAILIYAFVWSPLQKNLKQLRPLVVSQSADLAWMQQQAAKIRQLNQSGKLQKSKSVLPLLTVVDQTAKSEKIRDKIKQIQPGKESGTAKIWFDKVVFEDWLRWLDKISAQDIDVTRVSITKSADYPKVNIRLELEKK
ncbi:MAG: type II secretion system protein M [Arenicellales bacterium]|mgnify:FL=1